MPRPARVPAPIETGVSAPAGLSGRNARQRRWEAAWHANGFPWCDSCGKPAVRTPGHPWRHATPAYEQGLPLDLDPAGHKATAADWHDLPTRGDAGEL